MDVPPSNLGEYIGTLPSSKYGTDVSFINFFKDNCRELPHSRNGVFIVGGETFHAHRFVLAAHSSAFKAELLGSMAEAPSITTLHEIAPATFEIMLQFIYTDALPGHDELGNSPTEMLQYLLAAAPWTGPEVV
jgi:speckle-type POZ protein